MLFLANKVSDNLTILSMDRILNQLVGKKIHNARKDLKLTQRDLAKAVGLTPASISNIELGIQTIQLEHLYKIALILKLDIADLLPSIKALHEQSSLDKAIKKLPQAERNAVMSLRARMSGSEEEE